MFPQTKNEALAMIYLQTCNMTTYTPEQVAEEFENALSKIEKYYNKVNADYDKDHEFIGSSVSYS